MNEVKTNYDNLSEGKAAVLAYDMWQEMLVNGEIPDCKRYHDEFFELYKDVVANEKAPFYLMFCAFVGAMDINDFINEKLTIGGVIHE